MPYRAVFFDLDDTLYDDSGSWRVSAAATATRAAEEHRSLDPDALTDYFLDHSDAYWQAMDPTTETRPILAIRAAHWLATLEAFGLPDAALRKRLPTTTGSDAPPASPSFPTPCRC